MLMSRHKQRSKDFIYSSSTPKPLSQHTQLMQVGLALCTHVDISLYLIVFLDRGMGRSPPASIKNMKSAAQSARAHVLHHATLQVWRKKCGSLSFLGKVCRSPRSPARTEASVLRQSRARRRRGKTERREIGNNLKIQMKPIWRQTVQRGKRRREECGSRKRERQCIHSASTMSSPHGTTRKHAQC